MKKRLLALSSILGTSFLLLTGFDSSVTPESIIEDASAAISEVSSLDLDIDLDFLLNMEMLTGSGDNVVPLSMGIGMTAGMQMQVAEDDSFALLVEGNIVAMGSADEMNQSVYLVPSGSGYDCYTYNSDYDTWSYTFDSSTDTRETIDMLKGLLSGELTDELYSSSPELAELSGLSSELEYTLSSQPVTVNGVSCYELKSEIDGSFFSENPQLLDTLFSAEDIDETGLLMVYLMLDGVSVDVSCYVAVDTSLPVQMTVDFSDTDLSTLSQILELYMLQDSDSSAQTSFDFSMDSAVITINIDANNTPTVTVPSEALLAKEQAQASDSDFDGTKETEEY